MNRGQIITAAGLIVIGTLSSTFAWAEGAPAGDAAGAAIYRAANCVACHKWSGTGGGGYGGAAANLRQTQLDLPTITETVRCGHPGGGMPYFQQNVYKTDSCYGMKSSELDVTTMPAAAEHFLQPPEIAAVAQYVVDHFKGKGDPTYEECTGFFGHETHLCDAYPKQGGAATAASDAPASHHPKIEEAPDTNAGTGR